MHNKTRTTGMHATATDMKVAALDHAYGKQSSNGKQSSFSLAAKNKTPELTGSRMMRDPVKNLIPRLLAAGCLAMVLSSSIGCRGLNHWCHEFQGCVSNHMVDYSNRALAEKAWIREKHRFCDRQYRQEFKDGFVQGYLNVASGGDGCTPTIAPPKYWGWAYQTPYGQAAVNAFFQGYPFGAQAAEKDGVGYWNEIPTSGLSNALTPYGSGVITEEIVPMPVPEIIIPEAAGISTPNETSGATLTIESPSDATVAFPESEPNLSENATAETDQLIPAETGLQLPNSTLPGAAPPVAAPPVAAPPVAAPPVAAPPVAALPVAALPVAALPVVELPGAAVSVESANQDADSTSTQPVTDAAELSFTFE